MPLRWDWKVAFKYGGAWAEFQLESRIASCEVNAYRTTYIKDNHCCRISSCYVVSSSLVTLDKNRLKSSTSMSSESCLRCRSSRSTRHSTSSLFNAANNQSLHNRVSAHSLLFPRQTTSELRWLSGGKRGHYQNCSVLYCITFVYWSCAQS